MIDEKTIDNYLSIYRNLRLTMDICENETISLEPYKCSFIVTIYKNDIAINQSVFTNWEEAYKRFEELVELDMDNFSKTKTCRS